MPRQLRHHVAGGWYHITTRGLGRRAIFESERDREHFIELLAGMVERYRIILHAYVLMDNHYHLLVESPEGNVSRAMQWLNTSYGTWFNVSRNRSGPVFQNRFKSIPVDNEGSWAFYCSMYIHLNPVRIKGLGLGKLERSREKSGMLPEDPDAELVLKRLECLRTHRWSSYPAYGGYVEKPAWLYCEELWWRGNEEGIDPRKEYRDWIEGYLRQGIEEPKLSSLSSAVVIGSAAFVSKVRKEVLKLKGVDTNEREWKRLLPFTDVISAVEKLKGEAWDDFVDRHGDWARDLALYAGRERCGLSLTELGEFVNCRNQSVAQSNMRIRKRLKQDQELKQNYEKLLNILEES